MHLNIEDYTSYTFILNTHDYYKNHSKISIFEIKFLKYLNFFLLKIIRHKIIFSY